MERRKLKGARKGGKDARKGIKEGKFRMYRKKGNEE